MINYKHSIFPPSITTTLTGTYIVPGWIKVDPSTKLSDINWEKEEIKIEPKKDEWKFKSSSSNEIYTVQKTGFKFKCNCKGYWRSKDRECKHIKEIKKGLI